MKKAISVLLAFVMLLGVCAVGITVSAEDENAYFSTDAYANHWGRSDMRAWMNGLTKEEGNLLIDGSYGTKSSENFLNCFTDAELSMFLPKTVITNVFNDSAVLDSESDDKALTRTTSEYRTIDRFWPASGLLMRHHVNAYEDQLVSADPGYDLGNYYTYKQKVTNGKVNKWKNIVPIPFWSGSAAYYDGVILRSASYENTKQTLESDSGYSVEDFYAEVNDDSLMAGACGCIALPSSAFAAMAVSGKSTNGSFLKNEISAYNKLGKKDYSDSAPSWGIYLKEISLDNISGTLTYNSGEHTLMFESAQALPQNKHLMVQVYKDWDWNKEKEEDGTQPETLNARVGDTVFTADKEILSNDVTSVTFTFTGNEIPNLRGYTVKIWIEQEAANDSLAQASTPLSFTIEENGAVESKEETKSLNPRVFAYKSDLSCSWGMYNNEEECTFISHGESEFNGKGPYEGIGATYQKLYIGTDESRKPIEWWIAGREGDTLTLYQCSGLQYKAFNEDTDNYEGTVRNPSLYLAADFTSDDIEIFTQKVTLSKVAVEWDDPSDCDGEVSYTGGSSGYISDDSILDVPADKLSLQFCKTDGSEWSDAPDSAGEYYVRAAFAGATIDGDEYAPCFSNVRKISYTPKTDPDFTLSVPTEAPVYGNTVTITATLPVDATGTVVFHINGKEYSAKITDGIAQITLSGLVAEEYSVTASYGGDDIYSEATAETTFTVNRHSTQIYLEYEESTYSDKTQEIRITLDSLLATGYVIVSLKDGKYTVPLENGLAKFTTPLLPAGNYKFTADYPGDENHTAAQASATFKIVTKDHEMTLTVSPENPVYGDTVTATANLPEDAEGTVDFSIDDSDTYTSVTVENGKAVYEIKGLSAESHKVDAVYHNDDIYSEVTAETEFTVNQKNLTITANDQTYPYNGSAQGEGDTVYEDSAVIKEKVAVDGLVEGDALTSITLNGAEKDIGKYEGKIVPSEAAIGDKTANYNITYAEGKLTIASVTCPLTIKYVYENGDEASTTYTGDVEIFKNYSVTSPEIANYTPSYTVVEGAMENLAGVEVTVTYTANTYKITYVIDGNETEVKYGFGAEVEKPADPVKDGFTFTGWDKEIPETMPAENLTITAEFEEIPEPAEPTPTEPTPTEPTPTEPTPTEPTPTEPTPTEPTPTEPTPTEPTPTEPTPTEPTPTEPTPTEPTPTETTPTDTEPAHEHDYKEEVTTKPTCTEDGIMTYTCECGESYNQEIPKTGHKPGEWTVVTPATTEAAGKEVKKCEVCGETIAEREIAKLAPDTADAEIVGVNLEKTNAFGIANAFGVNPEKLPAGSTVTWYVNGEKAGEGNGFRVDNPTEDYTIKAVVTNRDGKVIGETEETTVKVNNSFFARLYYWLCRIIQKAIDFFKGIGK